MNQPNHRTEGREHPRTGNRPVKKEIFGTLVGSGALLIIVIAERLGLPMTIELALALSGFIGGLAGYLKGE